MNRRFEVCSRARAGRAAGAAGRARGRPGPGAKAAAPRGGRDARQAAPARAVRQAAGTTPHLAAGVATALNRQKVQQTRAAGVEGRPLAHLAVCGILDNRRAHVARAALGRERDGHRALAAHRAAGRRGGSRAAGELPSVSVGALAAALPLLRLERRDRGRGLVQYLLRGFGVGGGGLGFGVPQRLSAAKSAKLGATGRGLVQDLLRAGAGRAVPEDGGSLFNSASNRAVRAYCGAGVRRFWVAARSGGPPTAAAAAQRPHSAPQRRRGRAPPRAGPAPPFLARVRGPTG